MGNIRVVVAGGTGRTGSEAVRHLVGQEDLEVVGVLARSNAGKSISVVVSGVSYDIPVFSNIAWLLEKTCPHVLVDFTSAEVGRKHFFECIRRKIHPVIGTTGFTTQELEEFRLVCKEENFGAAVIPNFSLGAMATQKAAGVVGTLFRDISILEMYPHSKKDAPSGTSASLRQYLKQVARPPAEIPIHSVRLNGLVSRQEVKFGSMGETVTIIHEVTERSCFGSGVGIAVRNIAKFTHLVSSLEELLCV